jgi:hypothetical protein
MKNNESKSKLIWGILWIPLGLIQFVLQKHLDVQNFTSGITNISFHFFEFAGYIGGIFVIGLVIASLIYVFKRKNFWTNTFKISFIIICLLLLVNLTRILGLIP